MTSLDAFQPFGRLVPILLLGHRVSVPENNVLLRGFQFLAPELPFGPWCWNGDCGTDRIRYRLEEGGPERIGLSCQILVRAGMEITEISPSLRYFLEPILSGTPQPAGSGTGRPG